MLKGALYGPYLVFRHTSRLILTTAVLLLFLRLPFGFAQSLFAGNQLVLDEYRRLFFNLAQEGFLQAFIFGLVDVLIATGIYTLPEMGRLPLVCLAGVVALWRFVIAIKLLAQHGRTTHLQTSVQVGNPMVSFGQASIREGNHPSAVANPYQVFSPNPRLTPHRTDNEETQRYSPYLKKNGTNR